MKLWIGYIAVEVLLLVCAYTDIRYQKIYNFLTLPAISFGILYQCLFLWHGDTARICFCMVSIAIILGMSYLDMIGGMGDAKLFIVLFLFLPPSFCWELLFVSCVLFLGTAILKNRKEVRTSIANFVAAVYQGDVRFLHLGRKRPFAPYVCVSYHLFLAYALWKGGIAFG